MARCTTRSRCPPSSTFRLGGKASLRLVNLSVAEYFTLQTLGIPMQVVGLNAKLLRDQDGNNTEYYTNSITLGGGESLDVILDASDDGCGPTWARAARQSSIQRAASSISMTPTSSGCRTTPRTSAA